jgi:diaminohydroxyphosphoribosylaminopyrimidine deaminase/5-amino-6-(5-phosphoribosylamino)uracil reductase
LALLGLGTVSPNPLVGCVIVHEEKIIGEGWHKKYGEAHAEVNAINSVTDKSVLPESTLYVTLEPCSHFGKTPPCADLIIREKIKKVVIANLDSNPLVSGEGIKRLRAAGVDVVAGVLEKDGREINKRFFTFIEKARPYIILKWAQTADGFVARENFDSKWISNEYSRELVHKWRSEEDAILVGTLTAKHDDPQLNVRDWTGRDPIRVVIDKSLKLDSKFKLFDRSQKTICYNTLKNEVSENLILIKVNEENFLQELIADLYARRIQSVIIEGGSQTLQAFIDAGIWDEARVFESLATFKNGIRAPVLGGELFDQQRIASDILKIFKPAT